MTERSYYVYIISCGPFVKVGFSFDVESRISALQLSSPYSLDLEYLSNARSLMDSRDLERRIHNTLDACRVRGEWFSCPVTIAINALEHHSQHIPNLEIC